MIRNTENGSCEHKQAYHKKEDINRRKYIEFLKASYALFFRLLVMLKKIYNRSIYTKYMREKYH